MQVGILSWGLEGGKSLNCALSGFDLVKVAFCLLGPFCCSLPARFLQVSKQGYISSTRASNFDPDDKSFQTVTAVKMHHTRLCNYNEFTAFLFTFSALPESKKAAIIVIGYGAGFFWAFFFLLSLVFYWVSSETFAWHALAHIFFPLKQKEQCVFFFYGGSLFPLHPLLPFAWSGNPRLWSPWRKMAAMKEKLESSHPFYKVTWFDLFQA